MCFSKVGTTKINLWKWRPSKGPRGRLSPSQSWSHHQFPKKTTSRLPGRSASKTFFCSTTWGLHKKAHSCHMSSIKRGWNERIAQSITIYLHLHVCCPAETQPCHEMSGQNDTGGPQLTSCRSMHTWVTAIKAIRHGRHSASLLNSTQSLAICHRQLTDSNLEGFMAHRWQCHLLLPFHDEVHGGTGCKVFFGANTTRTGSSNFEFFFFAFEMLRSGFKNFHASIKCWISLHSWISMLHIWKTTLNRGIKTSRVPTQIRGKIFSHLMTFAVTCFASHFLC